jgi:hypothetical protein
MSAGLHRCTEPQRTVHLSADPLIEGFFVVRDFWQAVLRSRRRCTVTISQVDVYGSFTGVGRSVAYVEGATGDDGGAGEVKPSDGHIGDPFVAESITVDRAFDAYGIV